MVLLQFSSWVALFSSSLPFIPCLLSQGPFPMLTTIIFLSWDPSHSPYGPSNPYAIPYTTIGQGTLFPYVSLLSILTQWNILLSFVMFSHLLSRSSLEYISPHTCTYSTLLICAIHASHLFCLESLAPRPNLPLPSVHLVAPELAKLLIISTSLYPTLKDSLLFYLCVSL